jgi:zinc/manganese transport system permease protein
MDGTARKPATSQLRAISETTVTKSTLKGAGNYMITLLHLDFVQNAVLAGTIVAIISAIVGYFVVLRAQAFASHALANIGFTGAAGAALLGANPLLGTFILTIAASLGIGVLGERVRGRDVEVGMIFSFALGLGVLFLNLYTQFATETVSILFGSLLSVSRGSVWIMLVSGLAVLFMLLILFRPLLFSSIDPEVAQARGVPVQALSIVFMILLAVTISEAVQVVGVLLVFALLIAPAATAERLTHRPLTTIVLSIILALLFTWGGLLLAFVARFPVSFYIAALAACAYFAALFINRVRTPRRYKEPPHPSRECRVPVAGKV